MQSQTLTVPATSTLSATRLRTYTLRNRRLLGPQSGKKIDPEYFEREETDIA